MHMADALISPAVGGTLWVASAGLIGYSARQVGRQTDSRIVPLMGVTAAFVFTAQMINFTIPGTGSSGHLGGGLMLAILLGPYAAFLAMASVLTIQALFFADGGLLALGCNVFNLAFFPAFIGLPLIYRPLAGGRADRKGVTLAALAAAVIGLQLGAFAVVLETLVSGISDLPFSSFLLLMQPIHLAIGVVEGLATAAVVLFVLKARPELSLAGTDGPSAGRVAAVLGIAALLLGGLLSWFASGHPDGLEWAIERTAGTSELEPPAGGIHASLAGAQHRIAFLPDYALPSQGDGEAGPEAWPAVDAGTSLSGIVGGAITLALAGLIGLLVSRRRAHSHPLPQPFGGTHRPS